MASFEQNLQHEIFCKHYKRPDLQEGEIFNFKVRFKSKERETTHFSTSASLKDNPSRKIVQDQGFNLLGSYTLLCFNHGTKKT